jgi:hypothetical protein
MSTKKQDRKDDNDDSTEIRSPTIEQFQREQQQTTNKVIYETKDNIKKTIDEARREIPRYTQIVNDFQENTIQAIREIISNSILNDHRSFSIFIHTVVVS